MAVFEERALSTEVMTQYFTEKTLNFDEVVIFSIFIY